MNSTLHASCRLALLLAPLAAASLLVGCVAEGDPRTDEQALGEDTNTFALGLGDEGDEVLAVHDYLRRFGYFSNDALAQEYPGWQPAVSRDPADPKVFDDALEQGVRLFQQVSGMPVTGVVDEATRALMQKPRCEVPDYYTPPRMGKVHEPHFFTSFGSTWSSNALTYSYANYTSDMSQTNSRAALTSAMISWISATTFTFSEVSSGGDISIGWYTGSHGDSSAFDNGGDSSGNVLAHAYSPGSGLGGDMHFDDYESWSTSTSSGTHLQTVAVHEMGHALGLGHSSTTSAVMYAYYSAGRTTPTADDLAGIWSRYSAYTLPSGDNNIEAGEGLAAGTSVWSSDGRFQFVFQTDGNLVLYKSNGSVLWAAGTNGDGADRVMMQEDGNLVMYKSTGSAVWESNTNSTTNRYSRLVVQNDGNVVIYNASGTATWSTKTCCQ